MYDIIYADPPWDYKGQTQTGPNKKKSSSSTDHYPTMKLSELKKLDIPKIANDDSLLFLWATSPHLDQAIELMKSWGFKYATIAFVWDKMKTNPGFYTMSQCEICLVGKRMGGKIPQPRGARNIRQFIQFCREAHSKKPDEARDRINKMFPSQKKIELFARQQLEDWDSWGLDVNSEIQIETRE